jgi:creatinine amidohydrolase
VNEGERDRHVEMTRLSWIEYRDRIRAGAIVILPVGAIEQHGYHLPLGVDAYIAEAIAIRVAHRVGGLVAPTVAYGYRSQPRTGGGTGFPGTTCLDGTTLSLVIRDLLRELARDGATRLAIVDGHFENEMFLTDGIELALRELRRDSLTDVRILKMRYFEEVDEGSIALLWPDGYPGMALEHAALMETSLMLHLAPELVHLDRAPRETAADIPPYDLYPPETEWIPPSGALSSPTRATAAFGEHLADRFVEVVAAAIERGFG